MCMSKGAPKKPEFGPCRETHGLGRTVPSSYFYGNYSYNNTTANDSGSITSTTTTTASTWITT